MGGATAVGETNATAIIFFIAFICVTLYITYWAAEKDKTTKEYYAAGREVTGFQNGVALAGDYI